MTTNIYGCAVPVCDLSAGSDAVSSVCTGGSEIDSSAGGVGGLGRGKTA